MLASAGAGLLVTCVVALLNKLKDKVAVLSLNGWFTSNGEGIRYSSGLFTVRVRVFICLQWKETGRACVLEDGSR